MFAPGVALSPVLCGEWCFVECDDRDVAGALILSGGVSTAVVDRVGAHGRGHGEFGEHSYLTANVSKLRQIPNRKHWAYSFIH